MSPNFLIRFATVALMSALAGCLSTNRLYITDLQSGRTTSRATGYGSEKSETVVGVDDANSCFYSLHADVFKKECILRTRDYAGKLIAAKKLLLPQLVSRLGFSPDCRFVAGVFLGQKKCMLYTIENDAHRIISIPSPCSTAWGARPVWVDSTHFVVPVGYSTAAVSLVLVDITNDNSEMVTEELIRTGGGDIFMCVSPNGRYLAISASTLLVIDLIEHKALGLTASVFPGDCMIAWSPQSDRLAYVEGNMPYQAEIIDIPEGRRIGTVKRTTFAVAFLDEDHLVCHNGDTLDITDVQTGEAEFSTPIRSMEQMGPFVAIDNRKKVAYNYNP